MQPADSLPAFSTLMRPIALKDRGSNLMVRNEAQASIYPRRQGADLQDFIAKRARRHQAITTEVPA